MSAYLNCASCGKPLTGGHVFGLVVCLNELCLQHGRQFTLTPIAAPHPYRKRSPYRRRTNA